MYIRLARVSNDSLGFLHLETVSYRVEGTRKENSFNRVFVNDSIVNSFRV